MALFPCATSDLDASSPYGHEECVSVFHPFSPGSGLQIQVRKLTHELRQVRRVAIARTSSRLFVFILFLIT